MYYVAYGLLWLISILPLRVLYILSDVIYEVVFYIARYRKKIVMENLEYAFPEKSDKERRAIAKQFYRNLIDTFIEMVKMVSVSPQFINRRVTANWDELQRANATGKSVQILLGHSFNWEWANIVGPHNTSVPFIAVYMPMTNKVFEKMFFKIRSKGGSKMVRATAMKEDFLQYRNLQYDLALVADQNPGDPSNAWWFNFFNRPAPFLKGPAKSAITNNTAIVFASFRKIKRGHYGFDLLLAEEDPRSHSEIELTRTYVRYLEEKIREYPDMWLWSHRRWKWTWKPEYGDIQS